MEHYEKKNVFLVNNFKDACSCQCACHKAVSGTPAGNCGHTSDIRICWQEWQIVLKIYILSFMLRISAEYD